eukprot:scaffold1136_cov260-Pinguiococcus_pyrenoidosus.AAC.13
MDDLGHQVPVVLSHLFECSRLAHAVKVLNDEVEALRAQSLGIVGVGNDEDACGILKGDGAEHDVLANLLEPNERPGCSRVSAAQRSPILLDFRGGLPVHAKSICCLEEVHQLVQRHVHRVGVQSGQQCPYGASR